MNYKLNYSSEGHKQYKLYEYRLNHVDLIWTSQVYKILKLFKIKSLNDIGCCYFQLYKEIKNKNYNYHGYDHEIKYIKLGLKKFPELKKKFTLGDIEKIKLRNCDCTIASAVINHLNKPYKTLNKILKTSKKIIILRVFLGKKDEFIIKKKGAKKHYFFHNLSLEKIKRLFEQSNFETLFVLDEATKFSYCEKVINDKYKRKMYLVIGYSLNYSKF